LQPNLTSSQYITFMKINTHNKRATGNFCRPQDLCCPPDAMCAVCLFVVLSVIIGNAYRIVVWKLKQAGSFGYLCIFRKIVLKFVLKNVPYIYKSTHIT
jgi:hypothetical protein